MEYETVSSSCSSCQAMLTEVSRAIEHPIIHEAALRYPSGTSPFRFTLHSNTKEATEIQALGKTVRMILTKELAVADEQIHFFLRVAIPPTDQPGPSILYGTPKLHEKGPARYIALLVDVPDVLASEEVKLRIWERLESLYKEIWSIEQCPEGLEPSIWRLKWFEWCFLNGSWPFEMLGHVLSRPWYSSNPGKYRSGP